MSFPRSRAAVLVLALASLPLVALAQDAKPADDPVVATVNGDKVYRSEVLEAARGLPPQYQAQMQQIFPMLVERVVDFRLLAEAADEADLDKDEEVKRRVAKLQNDVMREVYLQRRIDEQVNETALRTRYDAYIAANPAQPEVHARHILVEDEAKAKEMIVALNGGANFAELAQEHSTGPSSSQGGDLGYFTADQMVPEFSAKAFELGKGEYSKAPIQTQFGWHVIKVEDRREGTPPTFESMEQQLRDEASREVVNGVLSGLRDGAEIEIVSPLPPVSPLTPEGNQ